MPPRFLITSILAVALVVGGIFLYQSGRPRGVRAAKVFAWLNAPSLHENYVIAVGTRCGNAPFIFPTTGVVGFLWDDSFQPGHRHQGIDIFAGTGTNVTPVIAAFAGYLTRMLAWKSSVIVRVPSDPLRPGRQIWVYYTHMADPNGNSFISVEFPPGTRERYVEAGTELGRQGDYSGDPNSPVGVHLHLSVVRDNHGNFTNELDINNTYDPSPYFRLPLNATTNPDQIPACPSAAGQ